MNTGQIKKRKLTANFTTLPNSVFQDKNLSLKAVGLLCYLLHLPGDWIVNKTRLHTMLKDGRDAVLAAFAELEKFGYIETEEIREKGRFVGFNYLVSDFPKKIIENVPEISEKPETELPITEKPETVEPITGNPITDKPNSENPITENPELLKTNSTKNELKEELTNPELTPAGNGSNGSLFNWPEIPKPTDAKKTKGKNAAPREIVMPYESFEFTAAWNNWKEYKAGEFLFKYKSAQSEQAALMALANMANGGGEKLAIEILNHTMANGWKGFVIPKQQTNGKTNGFSSDHSKTDTGTATGAAAFFARADALNKKYNF